MLSVRNILTCAYFTDQNRRERERDRERGRETERQRDRERVTTKKKTYIIEKYFRVASLSVHLVYI